MSVLAEPLWVVSNPNWLIYMTLSKLLFLSLAVSPIIPLVSSAEEKVVESLVPVANRSTAFTAVAKELDLGGVQYSFLDFEDIIADMGKSLNNIFQDIQAMTPGQPPAIPFQIQLDPILDALGIYQLEAMGQSAYLNGTSYRNKSFFYMPEGKRGLFTLVGKEPQSFDSLQAVPADVDLAAVSQFSGQALFKLLESVSMAVMGDGGPAFVNGMTANPVPHTGGMTVRELIESLETEVTLAVRFDGSIEVPLPQEGIVLTMPSPQFAFVFENMGTLFEKLGQDEGPLADLPSETQGDFVVYPLIQFTMSSKGPYAEKMDPILARNLKTGQVHFVSHRSMFKPELDAENNLLNAESFKQATEGLPSDGNSLLYLSLAMQDEVITFREHLLAEIPQAKFFFTFYSMQIPLLRLKEAKQPVAVVTRYQKDGILTVANWPMPFPNSSMGGGSGTTVMTAGLLAAMAIPAFNKVREQSREKTIVNNLRQIASAGQQYILETGEAEVGYAKLLAEGYFVNILPVAGESYEDLVVSEEGGALKVETVNGKVVEYPY